MCTGYPQSKRSKTCGGCSDYDADDVMWDMFKTMVFTFSCSLLCMSRTEHVRCSLTIMRTPITPPKQDHYPHNTDPSQTTPTP